MHNLDYVPILSLIFILYEMLKIIFMKTYWTDHLVNKKYQIMKLFEVLYGVFVLTLFFHENFWLFGVLIILFTFISATKISEDVLRKHELSFRNRVWLLLEGISTIILLGVVIFLEIVIKH